MASDPQHASARPSRALIARATLGAMLVAGLLAWLFLDEGGDVTVPGSTEVVLPAPDGQQDGVDAASWESALRVVGGVPGADNDFGWCLDVGGGRVATTAPATGITVVDPGASGAFREVWSIPAHILGIVVGRAASDGTSIVVATASGGLRSLAARDGAEQWRISDAVGRQQPWFRDGVLLQHDGRELVRADPETGERRWRVESDPLRRFVGTVEVEDGRVYVAQTREQRDRFVQAATDVVVVLDVASGDELRRLELQDPVRQQPPKVLDVGIHDGELVTLEHDGLVVARDLDDASVYWRRPVGAGASSLHTSEFGVAVLVETAWHVPRGLVDEPARLLAQAATDQGVPCRLIAAETVTAEQ